MCRQTGSQEPQKMITMIRQAVAEREYAKTLINHVVCLAQHTSALQLGFGAGINYCILSAKWLYCGNLSNIQSQL